MDPLALLQQLPPEVLMQLVQLLRGGGAMPGVPGVPGAAPQLAPPSAAGADTGAQFLPTQGTGDLSGARWATGTPPGDGAANRVFPNAAAFTAGLLRRG